MKRNKELLWKSPFKLKPKEKERVEELLVLVLDSELKEAYELKNELDAWLKTSTMENAKTRLEGWITRVEKSGYEAFKKWFEHLKEGNRRFYISLWIHLITGI